MLHAPFLSLFLLFSTSLALSAQGPTAISGPHPNLYFRSDKARVEVPEIMFGSDTSKINVVLEMESGEEAIWVMRPPPDAKVTWPRIICFVQDTCFLLNYEREKRTFRLYSASAFSDLTNWDFIGSYEHEQQDAMLASTVTIIPYKNDKYLFVLREPSNFVSDNKNGVKFIEASLAGKKFVLGNHICVYYDGQNLLSDGSRPYADVPFPGIMDAWGNHIFLDGYVVLVSKRMGVFWILDTGKGTIRQKKLYNELTHDQVSGRTIICPIIANVSPAPDGSIIIAARPKKNAFVEMNESTRKSMEGKSPEEKREIRVKFETDNLLKYPEIEWWKLDVKDGTFSPMVQSLGDVPSLIDDPRKWFQFKFRVHPDERVTMVKSPSFS
jgi:hypothetical protein